LSRNIFNNLKNVTFIDKLISINENLSIDELDLTCITWRKLNQFVWLNVR